MSRKLESAHYPFDLDELPVGWEATSIAEATLDVQPGFACGKHNKERVGIPHLRPMNINPRGEIDLSEVRYVQPDNPLRLSINDILFNNTNSPAWVGKTAIVQDSPEFAFSNHMTRLRVPKGISPEFLAKQLHCLQQCGYFLQQCTKHVNQASISSKFLKQSVPFIAPPANEQQRIVKKITLLQAQSNKVRKALESIPPLLEKFRQSVLSSAFRGDLTAGWRAQNPDIEPAEKLLERILKERRKRWEEDELAKMKAKGKTPKNDKWKDKYKEPELVDTTDLPELPEGWCWVSLEELSWSSSYGTSTKCDYDATGVPVLRIPNIEAGLVNQDNLKYSLSDLSIQEEDYLAPSDFLIIRTNGSRSLIGRGALIMDSLSEPTFFASYLIRFRFVKDLNLCQWLSFVWQSPIVRNKIENLASTSAGQYNINLTKLNSIILPIPPKAEIRKINFLLENALDKGVTLSAISKSLLEGTNKLDQSILAKAFCGELVPQDPNDEPASQLLERIKLEKASLESGKKKRARKGRTEKRL